VVVGIRIPPISLTPPPKSISMLAVIFMVEVAGYLEFTLSASAKKVILLMKYNLSLARLSLMVRDILAM